MRVAVLTVCLFAAPLLSAQQAPSGKTPTAAARPDEAVKSPDPAAKPDTQSSGSPDSHLSEYAGQQPDEDPKDLHEVGGSVVPPTLTHQIEPKFPPAGPGGPKSSIVLLSLVVDTKGHPRHIQVVRSGGASFDKQAIEAVKQYLFGPATQNGTPVPVRVNIEVNFNIDPRQNA